MKEIKGDLIKMALKGDFDVIVHGCNCYCSMGAGLAKGIKTAFPEAYQVDRATEKGSQQKLGTISYITVERNGHQITVVNAYTQFHWRGKRILANYEAIQSSFREIKRLFSGKRIGYPKIGAGLARGDWDVIIKIINEELAQENHTLVIYKS
jgi:O-acetyl-ADP-ribose deacetylase (regulator of RNase III)